MPGKGNFRGWSTAPGAGRPCGDLPPRATHTIRARADEWELIRRYAEHVKRGSVGADRVPNWLDWLTAAEDLYEKTEEAKSGVPFLESEFLRAV